ncbi:MAG: methyltransferase domain-containing protein [Planctomycetes bacterium]|jgi:cyclopropane fatty-acyl-phospholipid synthase-like methyltransferase|nr:methyltransferase domain-containing protein [Planctomycetota bacterium]
MTDHGSAHAMYEALARWQWRRRRASSPDQAIELRKRLLPRGATSQDGPDDGAAGLDAWLRAMLGWRGGERVLDLGCGFGASTLRAAAAGASHCTGVTTSAFQVEKARELAARRDLGARCTFVVADFQAPPAGRFDVVFAIESLGHADDLVAVLQAARARLGPSGALVWVEDLRTDELPDDDDDLQELARCWCSPPLRTRGQARASLAAAGLRCVREVDLTDRVPHRAPNGNRWRARLLAGLGAIAPSPAPRAVLRAFRGGLALERLYARAACRYVVQMARAADLPA